MTMPNVRLLPAAGLPRSVDPLLSGATSIDPFDAGSGLIESRFGKRIFNLKACPHQLPDGASFAHRVRCKSFKRREPQSQPGNLQLDPQLGLDQDADGSNAGVKPAPDRLTRRGPVGCPKSESRRNARCNDGFGGVLFMLACSAVVSAPSFGVGKT